MKLDLSAVLKVKLPQECYILHETFCV